MQYRKEPVDTLYPIANYDDIGQLKSIPQSPER